MLHQFPPLVIGRADSMLTLLWVKEGITGFEQVFQ